MCILLVQLPVTVNELENAVIVIPEHITVVFVFLIEVNGSLNYIPDVVTGSFTET